MAKTWKQSGNRVGKTTQDKTSKYKQTNLTTKATKMGGSR
jgi:hypothetical protein